MKDLKHIKTFEQHQENLNISDVSDSKNKNNLIEIYNKMKEISNIVFYNMGEFIVKNSTGGDMTEPYVQIFKTEDDIPFIFRDLKDYVVNFFNRMNNENINLEFRMTFENEKGGLSVVGATYQDIQSGLYDEKEIIILTINAKC